MNAKPVGQIVIFLSLVGALFLIAGCASHSQSFNKDFNEHYPPSPEYTIQDVDRDHFKVRVQQGTPMTGPQRVLYLKKATDLIAQAECKRRGWQEWELGYIQDTDRGWMHVLVAEVTRRK